MITKDQVVRNYVARRDDVERVRINRMGEVHAYGRVPNSHTVGWYLVGYVADLEAQAKAERS